MRTAHLTLCLLGLLGLTHSARAEWTTLIVKGQAIAAVGATEVRVSQDGGRHFRAIRSTSINSVALGRGQTWLARPTGVVRFAGSGPLRPVALPRDAGEIERIAVGPDWLLALPVAGKHVLLRRARGWRRILSMAPEGGQAFIDPAGHTLAMFVIAKGCGGAVQGPGGLWRPDRPARQLHPEHAFWREATDNHRDWLLGACPETIGRRCIYAPERWSMTLGADLYPDRLRVSPDARWIAVQDGYAVYVFERSGRTLAPRGEIRGAVVAARRDGITIHTRAQRLVRVATEQTDLGPLPAGVRHVDLDPRGRAYALSDARLWRLGAAGWTPLTGFEAPTLVTSPAHRP